MLWLRNTLVLTLQIATTTAFATDISIPDTCQNNNIDKNMSAIISATKFRSVRKVMPRPPSHWVGDGFKVYPVFAHMAFTEELSPLLMFDYAEPRKFPARAGHPLGVGQHPHRGFETVTVAFQGEVEHHDSTGKEGVIKPGDVQWMTAGRGIIHEEYHSHEFTKTGGTFEMCQLWVDLPKKNKMTKPGYQAILNEKIPVVNLPLGSGSVENDDGNPAIATARIIAGEIGESKGAAETYSPVQMWDVNLPIVDSVVDLPYPATQNCIVFVRRGSIEVISGDLSKEGKLKSSPLQPQEVALMRLDGSDTLRVRVLEPDSSILILGGEPLNQPVVNQGPFVMTSREEIRQAIRDYQAGKFTN